jgi:regulator of CtrA degradation
MDVESVGGIANSKGAIFYSRTYDEALALIRETRDYLSGRGKDDVQELSNEGNFAYATESLRLTTQLTEAMAWLFFQRAIHEGEVQADEVPPEELHLQYQKTCLKEDRQHLDKLPSLLVTLMERGEALYRRIERLDQLAQQSMRLENGLAKN